MTDPLKPLKDEQARASSPRAHVWLSASAGTGKTHVLSSRVLRLLLAGVAPERILCLTFTRAGAAEMAERVHSRLAYWVQAKNTAIFKDLEALGEESGPAAVERARLLFASVLEATGGGLRIQTIHSFAQALLGAFPLEAGLVPGFRPLDERGAAALRRETLATLVADAEAAGDTGLIEALEALALRLGEDKALAYLGSALRHGKALDTLPEDMAPLLLDRLGLPADVDGEIASACIDSARFPDDVLGRIAAALVAWGTDSGLKSADAIGHWRGASGAGRAAQVKALRKALLTDKGEVQHRTRKPVLAAEPDYIALAESIGAQLLALEALPRQVAHARFAAQGLSVARAFARAYTQAKRLTGAVDYDDLIGRAADVLTTPGMADWIRYKLDQRTDHVLVDEAQDTNDMQWRIVDAAVDDFFEIDPEEGGRLRTLFAVGDEKQAIFAFQGTNPAAFGAARQHFQDRADHAGQRFDALPLAQSFRSVPAVLDVVDATLAAIGPAALGITQPPPPHRSARPHPGCVTLLPPTLAAAENTDDDDDTDIAGEEDWFSDQVRRHAERIAILVADGLREGLWLHSKGRAAGPGDVLILLRSRSNLAQLIVARLYEQGVPVAGVDRLRLQAPLAVQDLLAALRFAAQPDDDLNLATLLVSPLIGWSQDELMHRAAGRDTPSLWAHLRQSVDEALLTPLRGLLADADYLSPYAMLERILSGPMEGRRRLVARLGEEARDAIDELLNAAIAFEQDDQPALQRFIAWFDRDEGDIKRELAEQGKAVRVMTVHGAKGLQAPIVILADATRNPADTPSDAALAFALTADVTVPIVPPRNDEAAPALAEAIAASSSAAQEEHWRLLYVAMTRAEERLVVSGALSRKARGVVPEQSWHAQIERGMQSLGAAVIEQQPWGTGLVWHGPADLADAKAPPPEDVSEAGTRAQMPDWLRRAAPQEARPPRPLAPSMVVEDEQAEPPPSPARRQAAERGRLLHALFERLPEIEPARRPAAADRWLAQVGGVDDAALRAALIDHALAVIERPEWSALFAPDALAEAPISAVVGDIVIAGTVDRLRISQDGVDVIDFKTGMAIPGDVGAVPVSHLRQMAAYRAALTVILPDRPIRSALLYTAGPQLIALPDDLLDQHKPGLASTQHNLPARA